MPKLVFIGADGSRKVIEAASGSNVMLAAVNAGVEGIVAECGGMAACGTCHVYVDDNFLSRLPRPTENEDTILDFTAAERRPNSRLSCQIEVTRELEGMILTTPDRQL